MVIPIDIAERIEVIESKMDQVIEAITNLHAANDDVYQSLATLDKVDNGILKIVSEQQSLIKNIKKNIGPQKNDFVK